MAFDLPDDTGSATEAVRLQQTLDEALRLWGFERAGEPEPIADSVSNANFKVPTDHGNRFVRIHRRSRTRERLELEQRIIAWIGPRGIPVNPPLPSDDGRTLRSVGGRFVSVYPWLDVRTFCVPGLDQNAAAMLGGLLGRLQSTLVHLDDPALTTCPIARPWDTEASIEALSRVDDLIRYYPSPGEWRLEVQRTLRYKLGLLESAEARPYTLFDDLPHQPCHGDFHERNVLLDSEGRLVAVTDWEMAGRMPRLFELVQSLTWLHLLDQPDEMESYLGAYAENAPIGAAHIPRAVDMWWQASLHNTWAFTEVFVRGDRSAGRFFAENDRHLRRFADPAFRTDLAERIARFAG